MMSTGLMNMLAMLSRELLASLMVSCKHQSVTVVQSSCHSDV